MHYFFIIISTFEKKLYKSYEIKSFYNYEKINNLFNNSNTLSFY